MKKIIITREMLGRKEVVSILTEPIPEYIIKNLKEEIADEERFEEPIRHFIMDFSTVKTMLKKKMTDEQYQAAYQEAVNLVLPVALSSREEQLTYIAAALRERFDSGMSYSMDADHYNDPYGYFVLGSASCAGCTRATGLCLNVLGIPYEHVNENQYSHQWCRVPMEDGSYWICDAFGLYCGPEPEPYQHPYF
jgi:hypothetical protein